MHHWLAVFLRKSLVNELDLSFNRQDMNSLFMSVYFSFFVLIRGVWLCNF